MHAEVSPMQLRFRRENDKTSMASRTDNMVSKADMYFEFQYRIDVELTS